MKIGLFGNVLDGTTENKYVLTLSEIAQTLNGKLVGTKNCADIKVLGICTDSREAERGVLFVAMKGERVDGHDYIPSVLEKGGDCFICESFEGPFECGAEYGAVVVEDSVKALADLAVSFEKDLKSRTVGVTGSVGKTTTKEFVHCVLSEGFSAHKTSGNFNSAIGMPLVILQTPHEAEAKILEMGMGHKGDISYLSRIAKPDVGIITNVGHAHIEALGSRENICKAKLEILDGMKRGSMLLLNGDEPLLKDVSPDGVTVRRVSLENKDSDVYSDNVRLGYDSCLFDIVDRVNGIEIKDIIINTTGQHNVYAALFAYAVGSFAFGMSEDKIRAGLAKYRSVGYRQSVSETAGVTFIEDCYNAGPESMAASLKNLSVLTSIADKRGIAVLGDMLELGENSASLHFEIGRASASANPYRLILFGRESKNTVRGAIEAGYPAERILYFENTEHSAIAESIRPLISEGDIILFKASRGMTAEKISAALKERLLKRGDDQHV